MSRNGTGPSSPATRAWAAVVVGIVDALALVVSGVVGASLGIHSPIVEDGAVINLVAGPTFPFLAALMLRSRAGTSSRRLDRLAWLFLALGVLCTATYVVFTYAAWGLLHGAPLTAAAVWVESWLWTSVVPGVEILLLWFPTGTVVGPRWRWAVWGAVASDICLWLGTAFTPGPDGDFGARGNNPLGSAALHRVLGPLGVVGQVLMAVVFVAAIASLVVRYWRGNPLTRAQLRWLLVAVVVLGVTVAVPATGFLGVLLFVVNVLATVLLPVTLAVALTRAGYALPRVLVYGLLSTLLLLLYLAVVGGADALLGSRGPRRRAGGRGAGGPADRAGAGAAAAFRRPAGLRRPGRSVRRPHRPGTADRRQPRRPAGRGRHHGGAGPAGAENEGSAGSRNAPCQKPTSPPARRCHG